MKKFKTLKAIDYVILFVTLFITVLAFEFHIYSNSFLGLYLLFINLYICVKYRKNKKIFFLFLMLFYFNFSFVISQYIGDPSSVMEKVYEQLRYDESLVTGILLQIVFLAIINTINVEKDIPNENLDVDNYKHRKPLILLLQVCIVLILVYHIIFKITVATTLLEYSIFLFIFAFYFSKNDKKNKIITEIIMLLFVFYSIKNGERIAVLQIILVDFIINYIDKFRIKHILITMIIGIVAFTIFGLYGDFLLYKYDFKNLTARYIINEIKDRRFALDTSVSAYFTGISMIDLKDRFEAKDRIKNGIEYFTSYTLLGSKSKYEPIEHKILIYQTNYAGGFLTCRFYYWFGWIGVIFISYYVGFILRKLLKSSSLYMSLLFILFIATTPRWYLYDPSLLFRGTILFSIFYFIISNCFLKEKFYVKNSVAPLKNIKRKNKEL